MKPLTYHANGNADDLRDIHAGGSVVLIGGGPSAHPHGRFDGCHTFALNHHYGCTASYRLVLDPPSYFPKDLLLDGNETLFAPVKYIDHPIDGGGRLTDNPACRYFFTQLRGGDPARFFEGKRCDFGDDPELSGGGVRCCMLPAFRLIHYLGYRTVYMVGVDCEYGTHPTIPGYYERLANMMRDLRGVFEANGLTVFNCNPNSGIDAFEHRPYSDAINAAGGWTRRSARTAEVGRKGAA